MQKKRTGRMLCSLALSAVTLWGVSVTAPAKDARDALRSLASIESYLQKYPSISFVLDVHRVAVQDANGQQFKLLCGEDKNAAQLEFVIGSNGGGLSHDLWRENLKLACAVQETLYKDYPTLMRPVTVRNSRYNQHMTTGSLLVEVGTAGNSLEEAVNAARLFAAGFAKTIQNGT